MANNDKTTTLKVPEDIYNRLTKIKQKYDCTYSEVIEKLVEFERENNYIKDIQDFIFITSNGEHYFRILFKKQENIFEYQTSKGYVRDKKNWNIHPNDKTLFTKFINKKESMTLLKNMGRSMEFDKFVIIRV